MMSKPKGVRGKAQHYEGVLKQGVKGLAQALVYVTKLWVRGPAQAYEGIFKQGVRGQAQAQAFTNKQGVRGTALVQENLPKPSLTQARK